jgi:hypothetical protein
MTDTDPRYVVGLRSAWEVTAGLIPGKKEDHYTKRFFFTSDDPEREFHDSRKAALEYAETLMAPQFTNWVRLDWIWL